MATYLPTSANASDSYVTGRGAAWFAFAMTLTLTAVFDNVIIGSGLVDYHPELHLGLRLGLAPIEDFAYTVAALALLPALWAAIHREDS